MDLTATMVNPALWIRNRISPCWSAATASGLIIAKVRSRDTKNPPSNLEIFGGVESGHRLKSVPLRRRAKACLRQAGPALRNPEKNRPEGRPLQKRKTTVRATKSFQGCGESAAQVRGCFNGLDACGVHRGVLVFCGALTAGDDGAAKDK